ncbi:MAG: hypothetical protein RLZZ584_3923, partial [Pseudomonadota bacterium]
MVRSAASPRLLSAPAASATALTPDSTPTWSRRNVLQAMVGSAGTAAAAAIGTGVGAAVVGGLGAALPGGAWAAGSDKPEKEEVRIGFIPLTDCASVVMASVLGFDRTSGIKIIPTTEASWAGVRDKRVNGELD